MACTTTTTPGASVILAMHARYETSWEEYNRLDEAVVKSSMDHEGHMRRVHLGNSQQETFRESEALRFAILRQVPSDWREAVILQFHVWGIYDSEQNTPKDHAAIEVALDHLLDFMCGEGDYGGLGDQFANGEKLARERRRLRTGMVEA
jgi:hypothetical protein